MAADSSPWLVATSLERRFGGVPALAGVDLTVHAGEVVAVLGHNGAGKTTLLRVLALLLRPTGGRLTLFGEDAAARQAGVLRRIGYVGHDTSCYPDLTGEENLAFYARLFAVAGGAARVQELLAWTRLGAAARRPIRTYSRGMLQRLALARALVHAPDLVMLDEPFTGLDPDGVETLCALLGELRAAGRAVLLSTHDLALMERLATRAVVLRLGRVAWSGAPADAVAAMQRGGRS